MDSNCAMIQACLASRNAITKGVSMLDTFIFTMSTLRNNIMVNQWTLNITSQ